MNILNTLQQKFQAGSDKLLFVYKFENDRHTFVGNGKHCYQVYQSETFPKDIKLIGSRWSIDTSKILLQEELNHDGLVLNFYDKETQYGNECQLFNTLTKGTE